MRTPLQVGEGAKRSLEQRLAVRVPWAVAPWQRLIAQLSPSSRLRQALLVRTVQGGWEAFNRRDHEVLVLMYHPAVEFRYPEGTVGVKAHYRGLEGYREFPGRLGQRLG